MSDYDRLAEQQLRQDVAMEEPSDILNDAALGNHPKPSSGVVSPTKRKRNESATVEQSPSKRVKNNKPTKAVEQAVTMSPTTAPKKLGRPAKKQSQHMITTLPAVRKSKGDIWDPKELGAEERPQKLTANKKGQKSKSTVLQRARVVRIDNDASPVAEIQRTRRKIKPASASLKDQKSPSVNEAVDLTWRPGRKSKKAKGQGTNSGQEPPLSLRQKKVPPKPSEVIQAADDIGSKPRGGKRRTPDKLPQDDVNDGEDDAKNKSDDSNGSEEGDRTYGEAQGKAEGRQLDPERPSQEGEGNEVTEESMDLLGQEKDWEKVLKSARSVHKTKIATETIRELLLDVREAKSMYKQLRHPEDDDTLDESRAKLDEVLELIEERIESIAEDNEPSKRSEMIRDIYGRAIPDMVFLLRSALLLHTSRPRGLHNYSAIKEVVRLQTMIVDLCTKAKAWRIKPNTTHPIMKPTTSVILPYIRDMRNRVFVTELEAQKRREKIIQNRLRTLQKERELFEQSQYEAAILTQRQEDSNRRLDHIREELERLRKYKRPLTTARQAQVVKAQSMVRSSATTSHEWTKEQTGELIVQLGKRESRDRPGN